MFQELFSQNGLSLDRLRHFAMVVDQGSIRAVSQGDPARQSLISRQIRELEVFFGVELTRRKGRGLEITEAGLELARAIRLMFQSLDDFKQTRSRGAVEVRVAAGNSVLEWMLIPALGRSGFDRADIRWSYRVVRTRDVVEGLLNHSLDFGLIRENAVVRPLKSLHLRRVGYALYVPKEWPMMDAAAILEHRPWALTVGGEFRRQFESAALKANVAGRPTHVCTSFTQAARLVERGSAAAVLPEIASLPNDVRKVGLPWLSRQQRSLALVWHPRNLEVRPPLEQVRKRLIHALAG